MTTATTFKHVLMIGSGPDGRLFITVDWDGKRLSFTGVEGPKSNGDCKGSCGQCIDAIGRVTTYADGWDQAKAARLRALWDRWHLNDLRAGCEHQRNQDTGRMVEVVSYKLTHGAYKARQKLIDLAAQATAEGRLLDLSPYEKALLGLQDWYKRLHSPPDADSPLSGCYEVEKRESKAVGLVTQSEHPEGLLSKPCPECGYRYGSAWLTEEVPADVLAEVEAMPQSAIESPWQH